MNISLMVIFGIALLVCIVKDELKKIHAFIAVVFGLSLASTEWGPKILTSIGDFLAWANGMIG